MTLVNIDLRNQGYETGPDDRVIFYSLLVREGEFGTISTAPVEAYLVDGKATVDLAPGPVGVQIIAGQVADTRVKIGEVPPSGQTTLNAVMMVTPAYTPALQQMMIAAIERARDESLNDVDRATAAALAAGIQPLQAAAVAAQAAAQESSTDARKSQASAAMAKASAAVAESSAVTATSQASSAISRVAALEALGGLSPESPVDGQTANLISQPDTLTRQATDGIYASRTAVQGVEQKARDQWSQSWSQVAPAPTPRWQIMLRPTTTIAVTVTSPTIQAVHADLKVSVVVPPSGKLRYTVQAGVAAPAGGALRWGLRVGPSWTDTHPGTVATVDARYGAAVPGGARLTTMTGELSTDASGVALVPGKTLVIELGHSAPSGTGSTEWGGNVGTAVITVEPIRETTVMEKQYAATISAPGAFVPLWLCDDKETVLGITFEGRKLAWSTDDGATHEVSDHQFLGNFPQHVRETGDGELIVAVGAYPGLPCSLWRSTGWSVNRKTATYTKVWEDSGADPAVRSSSWEPWSLSQWGRYVVAAPYGASGDATMPAMGRYVWFSEDHGKTGKIIFDLAEHRPGPFVDIGDPEPTYRPHLHGIAYDPWWDAIWVCSGDYGGHGVWVSFDHGDTWQEIATQQMTTIYPMADAVLMVTDSAPNVIYRIPRTSRTHLKPQVAHMVEDHTQLTNYGTMMYRNPEGANAPVLVSMTSAGSVTRPGRIFASLDGVAWREIWTDTQTYLNQGVRTVMGPTKSGKILARLDRAGNNTLESAERLTLTPVD